MPPLPPSHPARLRAFIARRSKPLFIVLLAFLAAIGTSSAPRAQIVSSNIQVSSSSTYDNEPAIAGHADRMVAVWWRKGDGKQVLDGEVVGWGYSLDGGMSWNQGGGLPHTSELIEGLPSICATAAGEFYCAARIVVANGYGIGLFRGAFGGSTFAWQGPITAVPTFPFGEPPDMPRVTCDPDRGHVYLIYTHVIRGGDEYNPSYTHTIKLVRSLDGGSTWSAPLALSSPKSNGARAVVGPEGELYVVWEDFGARQIIGRKSEDFGASFGPLFVVSDIRDNLGMLPPWWFRNQTRENPEYPSTGTDAGPGFPSLDVDRSTGPRRGTLYVAWPEYGAGTLEPGTGLVYEQEPNYGHYNATPVEIGQDIAGSMSSADIPPYGDCDRLTFEGTAGTTLWITGSMSSSSPHGPGERYWAYRLYCHPDTTAQQYVGFGYMHVSEPTAPLVYTLPADNRYYIDLSCTGPAAVSYVLSLRKLIVSPGEVARDHRDIVLRSSADGGATWTPKVRVNDDPPRYDNSLPEVAVDGRGRVHVAWYDRRDEPDCAATVHTYWSWSQDGGQSFQPSRRLSEEAQDLRALPDFQWQVGDHLALQGVGGKVYALWTRLYVDPMEIQGKGADIEAVVIIPDTVATGIAVPGFTAERFEGGVRLRWVVADARGIVGFRLHRAVGGSEEFAPLSAEPIALRGEEEHVAEDRAVEPGRAYRYRLEVLRKTGGSLWEGPVEVELPRALTRLGWQGVIPNPAEKSVRCALTIPRAASLRVSVYDLSGREVAVLHDGAATAGLRTFVWDGRDRRGRGIPAGVYLLRAESGGERAIERIVWMR